MPITVEKTSQRKAEKNLDADRLILEHYQTDKPKFAYIAGGTRKIAIDSSDNRARMQLLRHGKVYFSKMQTIIYAAHEILKPTLYIDVGVNYGECLFNAPKNTPTKIVGFEANPNLEKYITKSMRYNKDLNVELVQKAVSNSSGESLPFYINTAWSGKSSAVVPDNVDDAGHFQQISVPTTTLDEELYANFAGGTNLVIKVDVEGLEPKVIEGAQKIIDKAGAAAIFIEFDTKFLAGTDAAQAFFQTLAKSFSVYIVQRQGLTAIAGFESLVQDYAKNGRVHCDLLLFRASSMAEEGLVSHLCARSVARMAESFWNVPVSRRAKKQA
ncbi:FkbM family methyltransferase [Roseococcus sp. SYP-B2431]|uniref:FkbM family methyltransferase n=1 Tax=Roseococcus sp. SYP-B2431 TaxID=2496640 RepID=UPI00103A50C7|nr:FkbM family methyltransferase [Roseococcus sp. SYP-B2431]TCI00526.1 FkbM family methyltransferase [Roseococcus sp. SYP-B2431]